MSGMEAAAGAKMLKGSLFLLLLSAVGLALLVAAMAKPYGPLHPRAYARDPQFAPVKERIAFGDGRVWLMASSGELWSLSERDGIAAREPDSQQVLALCSSNDAPFALTAAHERRDRMTVRTRHGGVWSDVFTIGADDDDVGSLHCDDERLILLTADRYVSLEGMGRREIALREPFPAAAVSATLRTGDYLYAGFDIGEWGGGLKRIDLRSGKVETIHSNADGSTFCARPLGTNCTNVLALSSIPWKPDCVAAAVDEGHGLTEGRILQVCGTAVSTLFKRDCPPKAPLPDGSYGCAETVLGLMARDGKLIALSAEGLTEISADGAAVRVPAPPLQDRGHLRAAFRPDLVIAGWKDPFFARFALLAPR